MSVAVFSLALILWDLNSQLPTLIENLLGKFPKVRAMLSEWGEKTYEAAVNAVSV